MSGIFKAYDIRGVYPEQLDENIAERIGRAVVVFLKAKKIVVGRDMRPHSLPLFQALARGITEQGADVIDLGMCSTPMSYHANGKLGADAGVMITASHNPSDDNGIKIFSADGFKLPDETEDEIETLRDPSHVKNLSKNELLELFASRGLQVEQCETTEMQQRLKSWLALTKTPEPVQREITERMKSELAGKEKTGFSPYMENGEICFHQKWLLMIGKR